MAPRRPGAVLGGQDPGTCQQGPTVLPGLPAPPSSKYKHARGRERPPPRGLTVAVALSGWQHDLGSSCNADYL